MSDPTSEGRPTADGTPSEITPRQDVDRPERSASGRDLAEANADAWWWSTAMSAVRVMAATRREFTCYELVTEYGLAEPDHPNRWGALMAAAHKAGVIRPVSAGPSRRPTVGGSYARTWRGVPQSKARTS